MNEDKMNELRKALEFWNMRALSVELDISYNILRNFSSKRTKSLSAVHYHRIVDFMNNFHIKTERG